MPSTAINDYFTERKALVEGALAGRLPPADAEPRHVHAAMRYAALGGGKRLRPILALAVAEIGGVEAKKLLDAACAIEFVHTASLILDDLPAMDNSDLRRDKPATHREYGVATAILAAFALLSEAYALLAKNAAQYLSPNGVAATVGLLSGAIGTTGLIRGQHVDLTLERNAHTPDKLREIYTQKAGVLFSAAICIPADIVGLTHTQRAALDEYAALLGIAFQITDDIIDAHHLQSDGERKVTFVSEYGETGARDAARGLIDKAIATLEPCGERGWALRALAEYVASRTV